MRTKYLCCLFFGAGMLITCSLGVIAKRPPVPYGDNQFDWFSDVPRKPGGNDVVTSHIQLLGSGGIKVNTLHENGGAVNGKYLVYVDGSGVTAPSLIPSNIDSNFNALPGYAYFVSRSAVCTMPSAVNSAGKEIVVCHTGRGVSVTYNTVLDQKISGSASGEIVHSSPCEFERFMSDGSDWFKE